MEGDRPINILDDYDFDDLLGTPTQSYEEWLASLENGTSEYTNVDMISEMEDLTNGLGEESMGYNNEDNGIGNSLVSNDVFLNSDDVDTNSELDDVLNDYFNSMENRNVNPGTFPITDFGSNSDVHQSSSSSSSGEASTLSPTDDSFIPNSPAAIKSTESNDDDDGNKTEFLAKINLFCVNSTTNGGVDFVKVEADDNKLFKKPAIRRKNKKETPDVQKMNGQFGVKGNKNGAIMAKKCRRKSKHDNSNSGRIKSLENGTCDNGHLEVEEISIWTDSMGNVEAYVHTAHPSYIGSTSTIHPPYSENSSTSSSSSLSIGSNIPPTSPIKKPVARNDDHNECSTKIIPNGNATILGNETNSGADFFKVHKNDETLLKKPALGRKNKKVMILDNTSNNGLKPTQSNKESLALMENGKCEFNKVDFNRKMEEILNELANSKVYNGNQIISRPFGPNSDVMASTSSSISTSSSSSSTGPTDQNDDSDGANFKVIVKGDSSLLGNAIIDPSKVQIDKSLRKPVKKRKNKKMIPDTQKNDEYWAKRAKNNADAKKSREARRVKENGMVLHVGYLEDKYLRLQQEYVMALQNAKQDFDNPSINQDNISSSPSPRVSVIQYAHGPNSSN